MPTYEEIRDGSIAALEVRDREIVRLRAALKELVDGAPLDSEWGYCSYCLKRRGHTADCQIAMGRIALGETV